MTDYLTWAYFAEQVMGHWWLFPVLGAAAVLMEWRFRHAEERIARRVAGLLT